MLCLYVRMLVHVVVVGASPAVESADSCREGASSIPAARVAPLPKTRLHVSGCSECAPPAAGLQDTQAALAAGGGGGAFFLVCVGGRGSSNK